MLSGPQFIGIGAQKAGTTWLSQNLQPHPELWTPRIKELHYFNERINDPATPVRRIHAKLTNDRRADERWRRQLPARLRRQWKKFSVEDLKWDLKYYLGRPTDEWYLSLFAPGAGRVAGEITPAYSTLAPEEISHVHALVPEARIIFFMRNPIERAYSQAVMSFDKKQKGTAKHASEEKFRRHFAREGSLIRTDYGRTIENWRTFYAPKQIFVGFLEDVHFHPEALLRSVYEFLGVDASFKPPGLQKRVHARSAGRVPAARIRYLAGIYREEARSLEARFGGYAAFWAYGCERLMQDSSTEEELPYPLWESALWDEWGGGRNLALQSGPLSTLA